MTPTKISKAASLMPNIYTNYVLTIDIKYELGMPQRVHKQVLVT